jgi:formate dehydrogenase major subunit
MREGKLVDIEGNPRSPINQGTLCPKGAATRQLVQQPGRLTRVLYRRPGGTELASPPAPPSPRRPARRC